MTNITYLFGAGASANAIPVNKYLRDDIKEYAKFLNNDDFKKALRTKTSTYDNNKTKEDLLKSLIKDLTWLYEESEDFVSIDTLAKKFFLTKEIDNLRKLKVCLSIYLTIRQCKGKTDKRYDNFYASILKSNYSAFPRNIKVLSWNYDTQFELAYSNYSNQSSIIMNKRYINLTTGKSCEYYDTEEFCIFKLNGSIGYYTMLRTMMIVDNNTNEFNVGLLEEIIDRYEDFKKKKIDPLLDFAWILEKTYGNGYFDIILNSIKETNILVVIGYSFPFFNRIIDKEIINKMGNLQKVYFQSPDPEPMKERFFALRNDISNNELDKNLFLIRDKEQFFIPFELE